MQRLRAGGHHPHLVTHPRSQGAALLGERWHQGGLLTARCPLLPITYYYPLPTTTRYLLLLCSSQTLPHAGAPRRTEFEEALQVVDGFGNRDSPGNVPARVCSQHTTAFITNPTHSHSLPLNITNSYSLLTIQYYNCNYLFQWDRLELFLEQAAGMEAPDTDGIISDVLKRHGVKRPIDVVILELCRLLAMSDVEAYEEVQPRLTFGGK